jgi:NADH-quinone oxidoreductase subunit A
MPSNYYELYFPILCQVILAAGVAAGLVGGGLALGKRVRNSAKDTPYESGMQPIGSARERFSVKFFLVAMVFILFDIEAIFLYPWAVVFRELARESRMFPFVEMLLFIVLVLHSFGSRGFLLHLEEGRAGLVAGSDGSISSGRAGYPKAFGPRVYANRRQAFRAVGRKVISDK